MRWVTKCTTTRCGVNCDEQPMPLQSEGNSARELSARASGNPSGSKMSGDQRYSSLPLEEKFRNEEAPGENSEEYERMLSFARTSIGVTMRASGECKVEESVYGAAIVMPQLARTAGWDKCMLTLTIHTYIFLGINLFLQAYLLRMIAKEETVMDGFAGQMFLCDFGAHLENCPGPGCLGPFGTQITAPRMYSWGAIASRMFVKDSLKALFPDMAHDINEKVDPGEYGIESYWCRLCCCFIFMISCMGELVVTVKMVQLLLKIPTRSEPWIEPKLKKSDIPPGDHFLGGIEEVTIKIAGMPCSWKIINLVLVVLPKFFLWRLTAATGITVLMETSGIDDIITNSVGLTFILSLDELIGLAMMSEETLNFVRACEQFPLFDKTTSCVGDMSLLSDEELMKRYRETQKSIVAWGFFDVLGLFPIKLLISLLGTALFVYEYYVKHCVANVHDNHRMISKNVYVPLSTEFTWLNAFMGTFFPVEVGEVPAWKMPHGHEA